MKSGLLLIALTVIPIFNGIVTLAQTTGNPKKPRVEIYSFHGKMRCPACISIEVNTLKTIDTYFGEQVKAGLVSLKLINVDDRQNKAIAEKYEAAGTALFITRIENGREKKTDLTEFAFNNALYNPVWFIAGLKAEIEKNLK